MSVFSVALNYGGVLLPAITKSFRFGRQKVALYAGGAIASCEIQLDDQITLALFDAVRSTKSPVPSYAPCFLPVSLLFGHGLE